MSIHHLSRCPSANCIGLSGVFFWRQSINNLVFVFAITHIPPPSASWVRMQSSFRDTSSQAVEAITIRQNRRTHSNGMVATWWKIEGAGSLKGGYIQEVWLPELWISNTIKHQLCLVSFLGSIQALVSIICVFPILGLFIPGLTFKHKHTFEEAESQNAEEGVKWVMSVPEWHECENRPRERESEGKQEESLLLSVFQAVLEEYIPWAIGH